MSSHFCGSPDLANHIRHHDTLGEFARTACTFSFYGNLASTRVGVNAMRLLEAELHQPTGVATVWPPELRMDALMISQKCSAIVNLKNIEGTRCVGVSQWHCVPMCHSCRYRADEYWRRVSTCDLFPLLLRTRGLNVLCRCGLRVPRIPRSLGSSRTTDGKHENTSRDLSSFTIPLHHPGSHGFLLIH